MADLSKDDKERTANMGLIGAIFGIGFIIGPVIGSLLSQISIATPFWFVGGLASANMVAAYLFLPETNLNLVKNRKISINPFSPIAKAIRDNVLRTRYAVLFLFGLAISVQQSIFALYTQSAFGFGVQSTGYLMTLMGAIMVVNQGFLLKNFWLKKFKESQLEIWLLLVFAIAFFVMSAANLIVFIIGLVAMIFMQSVLRAVMSSRITGLSDPTKKGEVAGIMASLMTASMVIGPLSVGAIFAFNQHLPFVASGIILLIAFFIMYAGRGLVDEEKCRHEEVEPVEVL
jgi:DHA1 family tetracycline resistance protein-like MFS transporter